MTDILTDLTVIDHLDFSITCEYPFFEYEGHADADYIVEELPCDVCGATDRYAICQSCWRLINSLPSLTCVDCGFETFVDKDNFPIFVVGILK